jgi:hypothetical protein
MPAPADGKETDASAHWEILSERRWKRSALKDVKALRDFPANEYQRWVIFKQGIVVAEGTFHSEERPSCG